MKYFKVFNNEQEYTAYIASSDFIAPNVSTLRDCSKTWINAEQPEPEEKDYFVFVARGASNGSIVNSTTATYWTSTLDTSPKSARLIYASDGGTSTSTTSNRCFGTPIRPILDE